MANTWNSWIPAFTTRKGMEKGLRVDFSPNDVLLLIFSWYIQRDLQQNVIINKAVAFKFTVINVSFFNKNFIILIRNPSKLKFLTKVFYIKM